MAHHHHAPDHPPDEGKEFKNFKVYSTPAVTPHLDHTSHEVEKEEVNASPHQKGKSILDYQIAGFPLPFVAVMSVIAIGVLGLVLKVLGLF